MPHSPSLLVHNPGDLSSPDPLANSFSDSAPAATRSPTRSASPPKRRLSTPTKTSRNKRSLQAPSSPLSSHSYAPPPVSPARTVTEQTLSPWKIRVTVEAEHEDGEEAGGTMTRTIKVPLREESSPLNAEHIARRGRRTTAPAARRKRSVTPTRPGGTRTRSRRQSVTDLNVAPLGDDGDNDEWTGEKPSPRKKRASKSKRAQSRRPDGMNEQSDRTSMETVMHTTKPSPPFELHEDADAATRFEHEQSDDQPSPSVSRSPELRQIDLNRVSVRQRSQSTKRKEGRSEWSDKINGSEMGLVKPKQSARVVSASSAASYPTPSPTSSYHGSDEVEKTAEATRGHASFDTMLESEGFTMIDLDTIPSARQYRTSPGEQESALEQTVENTTKRLDVDSQTPQTRMMPPSSQKKPTPIPSYLTMADDESDLSSNVPSSPPATDTSLLAVLTRPLRSSDRKVTPQTYSSPSLPPPPPVQKVSSTNDRPESPPREVLDAGTALQDAVISPNDSSESSSQNQGSRIPSPRRGDFFNGFSSGTKRELRAGLRFGEELAKRQRPSSSSSAPRDEESAIDRHIYRDNVKALLKPQVTAQVWRGETTVQHSPFATESYSQIKQTDPEHSRGGRMDNRSLLSSNATMTTNVANASSKLARSGKQIPRTSPAESSSRQLSTASRREHEWQLEREAVSRKIENADPSKVVVTDIDDDEDVSITRRSRTESRNVEGEQRTEKARQDQGQTDQRRNMPAPGPEAPQAEVLIAQQTREARGSSLASHGSDAEDDDDEDIWLEEAKDNSSPGCEQNTAATFTHTEQQRQQDRAAEIVNKPRRSLIPSPWKRGEDVAEASTLMSDGAMSGFFWQQQTPLQEAIKFGAGEIARQKRQSSGNFDLETMLSSPVKAAVVGQNKLTLKKSEEDEAREQRSSHEVEGEDFEEDESLMDDVLEAEQDLQDVSGVAESHSSSISSPLQPQTVPVNFNDSTMSVAVTPPRQLRPTPAETADKARLTPPRSAMKGARLSFSPLKQEPASEMRRVVFNARSLYLNSDGEESTMSARLDSPLPTPKLNHGFQQANNDHDVEEVVDHHEWLSRQKKRSGWLGWMLPGKRTASTASHADSTTAITRVDGADEALGEAEEDFEVADEVDQVEDAVDDEGEHWQSTKTSVPTSSDRHHPSYSSLTDAEADSQYQARQQRRDHHQEQQQQHHHQTAASSNGNSGPSRPTNPPADSSSYPDPSSKRTPNPSPSSSSSKLPSYLLPPSYPSLPTRDPSIPMSVSGEFTNTHFRTLHILHAKSQRPRFHAPKRLRPAVRGLLGWKMEVDESDRIGGRCSTRSRSRRSDGEGGGKNEDEEGGGGGGAVDGQGEGNGEGGVFEWTLGTTEAAVLERFMQEVELGHVCAGSEELGVDGKVRWGWGVEELARYLGMIVVGEAVRAEEGGKKESR